MAGPREAAVRWSPIVETILIVDGELESRNYARDVLTALGYMVPETGDPMQALRIVTEADTLRGFVWLTGGPARTPAPSRGRVLTRAR
jgi:hypothetical protein